LFPYCSVISVDYRGFLRGIWKIKNGDTIKMLTNAVIRQAKARGRQYKLTDGRGLYLQVTKTGKYFRFNYRFHGKCKTLALGVYPDISLKIARERWGLDV
jgi:hypothetical protein